MWSDDWFETLKPTEKLVWIYLLTNAQTNMLGIYEVSFKRISFETGLKISEINDAFKVFESVKKSFYWFGMVVLPNWMKNQALNTNMLTSASRLFDSLPNELIIKLKDNGFEGFESLLKGCQTLPKIEKEIESEIETGKGKLKEEKEIIYPFNSQIFKESWEKWKRFKKVQHNFTYKSQDSEEGALRKLDKLSKHNEETAIKIIEQSIAQGWQGLFELKTESSQPQNLGPFQMIPQG